MSDNELKAISARPTENDQIQAVIVVGTEIMELVMERRIAISVITALAQALDDDLRPM
jgi:hypothetical protein